MSDGKGNGHPVACFCAECRGQVPEAWDNTGPRPWDVPECDGTVLCMKCGKYYGVCRELNSPEDNSNMIHREKSAVVNGGGGGRTGKKMGVDYITADKLSTQPAPIKILGARVQPDNFKPEKQVVVLKFALKGFEYLWTLRSNNPNLETLCDALGDDETKWPGSEGTMYIEVDEFDKKEWIRIAVNTPAKPRR